MSAMPPWMVDVLTRPKSMEPANSQMEAMMTACFKVNVLDPTEVPNCKKRERGEKERERISLGNM